jgi:hypothetical protein
MTQEQIAKLQETAWQFKSILCYTMHVIVMLENNEHTSSLARRYWSPPAYLSHPCGAFCVVGG